MSDKSSFYPELIREIKPASGTLGVLLPGLGAVATTLIAGVHLINKGVAQPYGSLTQMQRMRLGKRTSPRFALIKEVVPLSGLNDLVFAGWDIFPEDAYQTACHAGVLPRELLDQVKDRLESVRPWPAVFEQAYVRRLSGPHLKSGPSKKHLADMLVEDIETFRLREGIQRAVMIWCGSTEVFTQPTPVHETIEAFEAGLKANAPEISPCMIYAYAAISAGVPFANGSPNLAVDIPALVEYARRRHVPIAGKDFKTGQTFLKTVVAPGLQAKMLGLAGWFSTNILGNRDGEVLDDQGSFKTKEVSKGSVLGAILQPELYPELYGQVFHKVRIEYYPPRGDAKEGWDNIDIFGWLGQPMQIKINFLCRDSILAAPVVLDLTLFLDLAQRAGLSGIQEWLSFYFKSPMARADLKPEHDLFIQHLKLTNTLRILVGEEVLDHSGLDYYESGDAYRVGMGGA
ncbi:MAG: inositol-3-phosphate synthase [bacterium]|uniref:Inositol-3-phosphate synthase n=1 Tax=Candidatus Methylomirabilis tolerans TaxID=3123416 RepID=A0AAJ1EK42_9BACT|nr:inositol-3-phosphate synthase [Candidatus Methylomirabilis sp.]